MVSAICKLVDDAFVNLTATFESLVSKFPTFTIFGWLPAVACVGFLLLPLWSNQVTTKMFWLVFTKSGLEYPFTTEAQNWPKLVDSVTVPET